MCLTFRLLRAFRIDHVVKYLNYLFPNSIRRIDYGNYAVFYVCSKTPFISIVPVRK